MSRKLDAAVAEALGRKVELKNLGEYGVNLFYQVSQTDKTSPFAVVPHYSTDGNAMLELIEEMIEKGFHFEDCWHVSDKKSPEYGWYVYIWDDNDNIGVVKGIPTLPEAVALAASRALPGKGWSE